MGAVTHHLRTPDGRILRYTIYGPVSGTPVLSHSGSPSTRWKRPDGVAAMEQSGVRVLVPDRPGYGGSTRQPGRSVAAVVADVRLLADAQGWDRFAVIGASGGGPHALACAALLPQRVTRCAVVGGIRPREAGRPDVIEETLRPQLAETARLILERIEAGGPEFPPAPGEAPGPPALDDPAAMARLRATFVDGTDGWVDDSLAFARPWGFSVNAITAPVGIWHGAQDTSVPEIHADWLLAHIPGAQDHPYAGGHLAGAGTYREIYAWLRTLSEGDEKVGA
jgi:pimeloyl-ACP methyl ester carboxylesterase